MGAFGGGAGYGAMGGFGGAGYGALGGFGAFGGAMPGAFGAVTPGFGQYGGGFGAVAEPYAAAAAAYGQQALPATGGVSSGIWQELQVQLSGTLADVGKGMGSCIEH